MRPHVGASLLGAALLVVGLAWPAPDGRFVLFAGLLVEGAGLAGFLLCRLPSRKAVLAILLAATVVGLAVDFAIKLPCNDGQAYWGSPSLEQYAFRCYNDVTVLYKARSLNTHILPYVSHGVAVNPDADHTPVGFMEYPVVTGLVAAGEALFSSGGFAFTLANAVVMAACALAVTWLLVRQGAPKGRVLAWALAPPLALYAFHNWDLVSVFFSTAGLYAFSRKRPLAAGVLLGLGASAKLYPALFLPLLGCELLRRGNPGLARLWGGALAAIAAVNLPFFLYDVGHPLLANSAEISYWDANVWLMTYKFQFARTVSF
ncbi:MAG: glycosyltransferase 87 family protein, partial [Thermoplasmatota archaeon]